MNSEPVPQLAIHNVENQVGGPGLTDGGVMGAAIRAHDWTATSLGPISSWPQSLRIALSICLNSRFPMFIWWGPDLINFYNDAYIPVLGKRHPDALGHCAAELWKDVWPAVSGQVQAVFERGEASWQERVQLVTDRNGYDEDAYFTYSHSPVSDETGKVRGLLCVVTEETAHVRTEERQGFLLGLLDQLRALGDPQAVMNTAVLALGRHLRANRVGYGQVQSDDETIELASSYVDGVAPLRGVYPLLGFGREYSTLQRQGVTVVREDVLTEPFGNPDVWTAIETRSFVSVPLVYEGKFRASLYVNQREPRRWSTDEVSLIKDVAARTWEAVERARAEEERRQTEERLMFALEAGGGVGTWHCDVPADRLYCNARFAELFSVDPARAAAGAPISEYLSGIHPDDRDQVAEKVQHAIATGGDYTAEYRVILANGSIRWLYARGRGHLDEAGAPYRFTGVVFDITDRKVAALRDSFLVQLDDEARPLTDAHDITQTAARLLGEHLEVNRCAYADVEEDEDTFNLTGDHNHGVDSIVGRYTFAQFGQECLRLMRAGEPYVVEDSEIDPRTEEVRDSYRLTRIRSVICVSLLKQGRFVAAMAVHQVSPRKWREDEVELVQQVANRCWESIERTRVARALQEREQRYRFLAESIPQMVWTANPDGELDYVNEQGAWYFGHPAQEVLGSGWLQWVHPDDRERTLERWRHSLETRSPYETSFRLQRASDNSWRWHLVRSLPLVGRGGAAVQWFGTCTDIEDQKAVEAELTRANRELEEFAYVASHDLQEPLRMVNIYTQQILRRTDNNDEEMAVFAGFVRQGVMRMQRLIQDLLTFSRTVQRNELPVGTANLSDSLADAVTVLRNRIDESGAAVHFAPLPAVRGDTAQLSHVFQNLISNALKYRHPDRSPEIHISTRRDGTHWIVLVQDNGIGFEQQYAERIFGLFKRLHKDEYPGTGLGLAICQRIVERYGGRMWAEGEPNQGAVFYFSLPEPAG